jgi:serine/threonine protein kinase
VGRVIGGRYRLVSRLGNGGMGTVWLAHDDVVDRDVAVKEPRVPEHLGDQERGRVYLRMQREARAAARIEHPSVVTMHDVVIEDSKPWIVMELVRGDSLDDRLQEGTLTPPEAARIGLAVLNALVAAHEKGVLHRDVKPDNILLGHSDRVVLSDFGIAQVEGEQGLTETGEFVGSPQYIAPERVLGQRPGPESDLWSLGVVLYAAMEGVSPFRRANIPATLQAVLSAEPQLPARGTGALGTLVMQLLRKDPAMRPDAAEARQVLEAAARPPLSPLDRTRVFPESRGTGGTIVQAWVPPVLYRNRKARYGFGGGVLAVAVVLILIFLNPFGSGLPEGWSHQREEEILKAELARPDSFTRQQTEDGLGVWYNDPSGVWDIYLDRRRPDSENKLLEANPDVWKTYYESGGADGTEIKDQKVTVKMQKHQGNDKAFQVMVDYRNHDAADDDTVVHRWHELFVPGKDGYQWRLRVSMPAKGKGLKIGEQIFNDVEKNLDINEF